MRSPPRRNGPPRAARMQIHAYDQEGALLGQGTVGLEFEEQAPLDTLLVAVGGGGLIGGIAAWYAGKVRIIGVEPVARADPHESAGSRQAGRCAGRRHRRRFTRAEAGRQADVSARAEIRRESRSWSRTTRSGRRNASCGIDLRIAAEAGGAAAYAALLSRDIRPTKDERVGVLRLRRQYDRGGFLALAAQLAVQVLVEVDFRVFHGRLVRAGVVLARPRRARGGRGPGAGRSRSPRARSRRRRPAAPR